jgi:exopolysaccharide production protein ExoQ
MRADRLETVISPAINWRALECWGAGMALFLQTGALFPLMLAEPDGSLGDPAKAKLRLLCLPVYAFTAWALMRNIPHFVIALKRNLIFPLIIALPFLSVFWSISPSMSLRRAVGLLFTVFLAYALAIRFTPRQLLLIAFATVGLCMFMSVAFLVVLPGLAKMPMDDAVRGIFIHKNSLGWYASIAILAAVAVLMDRTLGWRRTAFAVLAAGVICLATSGSMTAMIATGSAFCLIGFYTILRRTQGTGRILVILLFVQMMVGVLVLLHEFLVPVLESLGKDATLTGRVPLWELVDRQIAKHLIFGFGYQAFWTEANPDAWTIWGAIQWMAPHSHNGFRDTMLSFGATGTALFFMVLLRAVRQGAVLHCHEPHYGWLWLNVFLVMILVMNFTESLFLIQNDAIFVLFATSIIIFSLYAPVTSTSTDLSHMTLAHPAVRGLQVP